jgi:hypothetical protein
MHDQRQLHCQFTTTPHDNAIDTADAKSGKWTVVSYVPEFSNVRLKMLYSSSRDDIKSTLGKALFYNDFHATEKEEITWSAFQETKSNLRTAGPLTVREEFMREEVTR